MDSIIFCKSGGKHLCCKAVGQKLSKRKNKEKGGKKKEGVNCPMISLQLTVSWSVFLGQNFLVVLCLSLSAAIAAALVRGVTAIVAVAVTLLVLLFLLVVVPASAFQYVGLELAHV